MEEIKRNNPRRESKFTAPHFQNLSPGEWNMMRIETGNMAATSHPMFDFHEFSISPCGGCRLREEKKSSRRGVVGFRQNRLFVTTGFWQNGFMQNHFLLQPDSGRMDFGRKDFGRIYCEGKLDP
jgi:hypothetical protein